MLTKVYIGYGFAIISIIAIAWLGFTSFQNTLAPQQDFQFLASITPTTTSTSTVAKISSKKSTVASKVVVPAVMGDSSEILPSAFLDSPANLPAQAGSPSASVLQKKTPPVDSASSPQAPACSFATKQFPNYRGIVVNEVAWMGTGASANYEWLELFNPTNQTVNIAGWHLFDKAEQVAITFLSGTLLTAKEFFMLERGEEALPSIRAGLTYTGALSNTNEALRLFDKDCFLVDEVLANPEWPAGNVEEKRSMERGSNLAWHTYLGSANSGILGTPGKENSLPSQVLNQNLEVQAVPLIAPIEVATSTPSSSSEIAVSSTSISTPSSTPPVDNTQSSIAGHLFISEVMVGTEASANDEFIELSNTTNSEINLTGYIIKKKTSSGSESSLVVASRLEGKKISVGGRFVIGHEGSFTGISQATWPASYSLAYTNNSVALYDASGAKISEVTWAEIFKNQSYACSGEPLTCSAQVAPTPGL